jgi:hypothetical protein
MRREHRERSAFRAARSSAVGAWSMRADPRCNQARAVRSSAVRFLFVLGLAGCSVTEVVLVIDSDLRVPEELDEIRIEVDGSARALDVRVPMASTADLPLTHSLVPAAGRRDFEVAVTGLRAGTSVVADRRTSGWIAGESRLLPLWLGRSCIETSCEAGSVCSREGCRPIALAPDLLPRFDGVPRHDDPCNGARFCDGFEGSLDAWDFSVANGGSIEASPMRARSGTHSLRARIDGPGGNAFVSISGVAFRTGSTAHVRFHLWLSSGAWFANFNIVEIGEDISFQGRDESRIGYWLRPAAAGISPVPDRALETERWYCIELAVFIDRERGRASYSVDGVEWAARGDLATTSADVIDTVKVGIGWSNTEQPAIEYFIDDVAISDAPIGCD